MTTKGPWDRFVHLRMWLAMLYYAFPFLIVVIALMDRDPAFYATKAAIGLAYLSAVSVLQLKLTFWPCPRCGSPFLGGWRAPYNPLISFFLSERKCAHCGLPGTAAREYPSVPA
jgi:hypothetical protein